MRLSRLSLRGLTRFTDAVEVDFAALGPGLIAVVGVNGAGKTTLLEALPAALWKTMPTRPGSLYDRASGTDAYIEATLQNASGELRARLLIDAEKRTTEGYLTLDGQPITNGTAAEYAERVAALCGSLDLFLAGPFSCQDRRGSFIRAARAERKALFAELLGLGRLEAMATRCRFEVGEAEKALGVARGVLAGLEAEAADLPRVAEMVSSGEALVARAEDGLARDREAEAAAAAVLEQARQHGARILGLRSAAQEAGMRAKLDRRRLEEAQAEPARVRARHQERIRFVEARKSADLVDAARTRYAGTIGQIDAQGERLQAALAGLPDRFEVEARLEAARRQVVALDEQRKSADDRVNKVEAAEAVKAVAEARHEASIAERNREKARLTALAAKTGPCAEAENWVVAEPWDEEEGPLGGGVPLAGTCPLLADARAAIAGLDALLETDPPTLPALIAADEALEAIWADKSFQDYPEPGIEEAALAELRSAEAMVARLDAADGTRAALEGMQAQRDRAAATLAADLAAAAEAVAQADSELAAIEAEYEAASRFADAAIAEAERVLAAADAAARDADSALLSAVQDAEGLDYGKAEAAYNATTERRRGAESVVRDLVRETAAAVARRDHLQAQAARAEQQRAECGRLEESLGDWGLLGAALGKNGVQALEVDAAAPEVSGLCNELLACYGGRFTLRFETLKEKRSAPGEYTEVFDVLIYDGQETRKIEDLSGGEQIIVGEALGMALAVFNTRKNSVKWQTLFRDETVGALDQSNAAAYVEMLRRARHLGGFEQVIFIAHAPEVWALADARLLVEGGEVGVAS